MMPMPSGDQKPTLILVKIRRLASNALRPFARLSQSPKKRLAILSLGIITGAGIPAFVLAVQESGAQLQPASVSQQHTSSASTDISVDIQSSSENEGDFSTQPNQPESQATSDTQTDEEPATVTINGASIPIIDGNVSRHFEDSSGNIVDIQVNVSNSDVSVSGSQSSSSSTDITIDSTSSDDEYRSRGSPGR